MHARLLYHLLCQIISLEHEILDLKSKHLNELGKSHSFSHQGVKVKAYIVFAELLKQQQCTQHERDNFIDARIAFLQHQVKQ